MIIQTQSTSFIMQLSRPFHKEEDNILQRLELCVCIFNMASPAKIQVENGLEIFDLWENNIDVANQSMFLLIDVGVHYEEIKTPQ